MPVRSRASSFLRNIFRKRGVEQDLDDEVRAYLDLLVDEKRTAGLTDRDARRAALLELQGLEQVKEHVREVRTGRLLDELWRDVAYGARMLVKHRGFTAAVLLTLGFTTAAVATVLTLRHTLFVRDLPVPDPDTVVTVSATRNHGQDLGPVSYLDYTHFRDGATSLSGLAAHYSGAPFFATVGNRSHEVSGAVVSANFFSTLRVQPALGRFFLPAEDEVPGRDRVAVLSFDFWRDWFAGSPDALNATLRINATSFTVIGVAPQGFRGVDASDPLIYVPTMMLGVGYRFCRDPIAQNGCTILDMIGRVADGRTVEQADAEMQTLRPARWPSSQDGANTGIAVFRPRDVDRYDNFAAIFSQSRLVSLLTRVAALLLVACCANLASLLVTRYAARGREFAIRTAVGATSSRMVRQLLTESSLLALSGAALGLFLSRAMVAVLDARFYAIDLEGRPRYFDFSLAPAVVGGVFGVTLAAVAIFAAFPAMHAVRRARDESLSRHASPMAPETRWADWLIAVQVAIAVALIAAASLLMTGARAIVNGTYDGSRLAVLRVRPLLVGYDVRRAQQLQRSVLEQLSAAAGVESASPYAFCGGRVSFPDSTDGQSIRTACMEIGPLYFETIGVPVQEGREFSAADIVGAAPVAIVSRTLAERLSPGRSALGMSIGTSSGLRSVIGIVNDTMLPSRVEPMTPQVFVPLFQNPRFADARYVIRVKGDPGLMLASLMREVGRVDPDVPVTETMTRLAQTTLGASNVRLAGGVAAYGAILAMVLTAIGLYGVLAFSVHRRTKELGVRMALGASPRRVRRMVLERGARVIGIGITTGLFLAAAAARFMAQMLYSSPAADWLLYAAAGITVALVGLLASSIPAARAASLDPMTALRVE